MRRLLIVTILLFFSLAGVASANEPWWHIESEYVDVVDEIIEIEVFVKAGKQPPLAKGYLIRVDKEKIVVHQHQIKAGSGEEHQQREVMAFRRSTEQDNKNAAGPWRSVCAPGNLRRHSIADRLVKGD